jgi:DNA replication ATP-dependent helicase Dna2
VASIEGTLAQIDGVAQGGTGNAGGMPRAQLVLADGTHISVTLPAHTRPLFQALAGLPLKRLCELRLRMFHLLHTAGDGRSPHALRTTPASAVVLEPDLLLNITDINNAEYCVRQYPLRRMVPSAPTPASLRGTIVHGAFKELLKSGGTSQGLLDRALRAQATDLALRHLSYADVAAEAEPHLRALEGWYAGQRHSLWGDALHVRAETFLLAPEVGLKGRLDFLLTDERGGSLLELKTGAVTADLPKGPHRWQVQGYQTLLAARRPGEHQRPGATLLYSGTPGHAEGYGIPFFPRDLLRVLDLRNRLALVHATGQVPTPPGANKCGKCALRGDCQRASALLGWQAPPLDEPSVVDAPSDAAWFAEMYELLRLETRASEAEAATLWTVTAADRREAGIALGDLELNGEPRQTDSGEWEYTFTCANTSELREGDAVLLSDGDPVRGTVVTGTILRLHERGVVVWTPERIARPALIDRYESDIVRTRTLRNLWRWLDADPRLRALVSGERAPTFDSSFAPDDPPVDMNAEQRRALDRALAAKDYALVQGPPGTGKTRVVAEIARRAIARGERVLVAAFTNQAVDTVLRRLVANGECAIVRMGHEQSIAPTLHGFRLAERTRQRLGGDDTHVPEPDELRETLREARLVAATAATWSAERYDEAGDPLRFDLAIIDEASQLTVPALLGALRFARRFVLVGDERQLPPLAVSEVAAARGLKRSLFVTLLERFGDVAAVALTQQYRMHPIICAFPSQTFYDGRLEAAGEARTALLDIAPSLGLSLWPVLAPERPLVFVDVPAPLDGERVGKASQAQARVIGDLVRALLKLGVPAEEIGVVTPYRAQVAAVRQRLERIAPSREPPVTVDTVDRFQGGERRVVLLSFGGRAPEGPYMRGREFLADPNRLNVALTRAQRKLILVGDRQWLTQEPLLAQLAAYCAGLYGGSGGCVSVRRKGAVGTRHA